MLYLGIDVGKRWHEAALLNEGDAVVWHHRFRPTQSGLRAFATQLSGVAPAEVRVGLEATGIYWLTLHAWLLEWGAAEVVVLNPLQTKAFRNANLRGSKTDRIDAVALARLLHWAGHTLSAHAVPAERQAAVREISRLRAEMSHLRARQLTKLGSVLERLFPELQDAFSSLGSKSALAVLERWPTPALLRAARRPELTRVLRAASRGNLGATKAAALLELAQQSVGVPDPHDAAAVAVRTLVGHLAHLDGQITALAERLDALLEPDVGLRTLLESIPGVGAETARTWLAEAPPIERFRAKNGADKLVAAVGLDAQLKQSGRSAGTVRMSKRGNRYLRRALMLAARSAAQSDPQFHAIFTRQLLRKKHYTVAVSHVARKLVHVIYSVLLHQRPYELPAEYRLGIIEPEPQLHASGA